MEATEKRCWHGLFHAESASIRFDGSGYDDVPVERRPIILGRLRFRYYRLLLAVTQASPDAVSARTDASGRRRNHRVEAWIREG